MAEKIIDPVLVVSPDYRYILDHPMDTIVSDVVEVYRYLIEDKRFDPAIVRFYGTAGEGAMIFLSLLKIVNEGKLTP